MDIVGRFALTGDRTLLPDLANHLAGYKNEPIAPDIALQAACRLSATVNNKKTALSAWTSLWHLSDIATNAQAEPFLDKLSLLPECDVILKRCKIEIFYATVQRTTCFKFLAEFMRGSTDRARKVMDTNDLGSIIVQVAFEEIAQSPINEAIHAIMAVCHLSRAKEATHESGKVDDGERCCTAFLDYRGLQVLTVSFEAVVQEARRLEAELPDKFCLFTFRPAWTRSVGCGHSWMDPLDELCIAGRPVYPGLPR